MLSHSSGWLRFVSIPRPIPSSTTKSRSSATLDASSLSSALTPRRSITGRSDPLDTALHRPSARARARSPDGSAFAARGMSSFSSSNVTSLMAYISFAAITTSRTPARSSARASGTMPSNTSAPALSTNRIALSYRGDDCDCPRASTSVSTSSSSHGLGLSLCFADSKPLSPREKAAAVSALPRSNRLPARTPRKQAAISLSFSLTSSSSCSTVGRIFKAFSFSSPLTCVKTSKNPCFAIISCLSRHSLRVFAIGSSTSR
mmetsp:Transcript_7486/g.16970  ORF Transcript_7486/g.16970 Transcript_7486/m.16970 type:complete len:260 (-) Transcript_7486:340-1119(-)